MNGRQKRISKQIKQHWVPRFYLKEFSTPETRDTKDPQVWIFSRHEGDSQKVNIKDVAAKRYLYSPKNEQGVRCWRTEDKLAALESTTGIFWSCITRNFVNLDEVWVRKGVSLFMSTLMLRHPNKMDEHREVREQLIAFFDSFPKDASGRPNIRHVETKHGVLKLDTSDWFKYRNPTEYDRHKLFVDQISYSTIDVAKLLMEKRWSVIFSDEPCFITTDQPVTVFNQEKERFGLATKGTLISFPLSPTRVLVLDDRFNEPGSQFYPLAEHGPGPINITHWTHAHNFMISHRHPDEVNYEMVNFADQYEQTIHNK
jgi:ligand-binding SRPBCC domain-containing protein